MTAITRQTALAVALAFVALKALVVSGDLASGAALSSALSLSTDDAWLAVVAVMAGASWTWIE